jgi:hypothetical protein
MERMSISPDRRAPYALRPNRVPASTSRQWWELAGRTSNRERYYIVTRGHYFLSFHPIGSGRGITMNTVVTFGPYTQGFILASGDTPWWHCNGRSGDRRRDNPAVLIFESITPGNVGAVLDNVLITTTPTVAVPEPSTVILIAPALLMIALLTTRAEPQS